MRISPRWMFLAIFLACAGLMGYGYYLQHGSNLEPCPLCILQRYAFIAVGVIALVAAVHGPGRLGQAVYGLLVALAAGTGAGIAARQTWLQHNPPNVLDCGPDLAYMLDSFPLSQVAAQDLQGRGRLRQGDLDVPRPVDCGVGARLVRAVRAGRPVFADRPPSSRGRLNRSSARAQGRAWRSR